MVNDFIATLSLQRTHWHPRLHSQSLSYPHPILIVGKISTCVRNPKTLTSEITVLWGIDISPNSFKSRMRLLSALPFIVRYKTVTKHLCMLMTSIPIESMCHINSADNIVKRVRIEMHFSSLVVLLFVSAKVANLGADYTKVEYTDCGSQDVLIHSMSIDPMPIYYPGSINITLAYTLKRPIGEYWLNDTNVYFIHRFWLNFLCVENFQLSAEILRTVSGIRLPIRCYLINGLHIGSCTYTGDQLCKLISSWWPKTFGLYLTSLVSNIFGHNCNNSSHPVVTEQVNVYKEILELPDFSRTFLSFMTSGDFDVKITAIEQGAKIFCGTFKYTVKPKKIK